MCSVWFKGVGVGGSQVEWREPTVGLGIKLGAVLQQTARHGNVAPSAGAVQGRPPIDRAVIHRGAGGQ